MKELKEFTVERLEELSRFKTNHELALLAKIALAAKQANPVGYLFVSPDGEIAYSISNVEFDGVKLVGPVFATPPLNHTEHHLNVVVPDGFTEIQLIKAMTWINRVRAENPNMKEARTCADLILLLFPATPKPEM